jgi:hypothetical protein
MARKVTLLLQRPLCHLNLLDDDIESDFAFNEIYRDIPVRWDDQFKKFKVPMTA